jgi:adenylate cyclase
VVRRVLVAAALGLAASVLVLLTSVVPLVDTLEWKVYDQFVRWAADPSQASQDIVLVAIDEKSIRLLEPVVGRWPWPRLLHAQLIDFLARGPAKVVAYDVLFSERDRRLSFLVGEETWTGAESDQAFADAVKRAGNVVLAADATFEGLDGQAQESVPPLARHLFDEVALDPRFEQRPVVTPPYAELERAARTLGHNFFVLDPDGPVRRCVPFVRHRDRAVPLLGVAAALLAGGITPDQVRVDGNALQLGGRRLPLLLDELPRFEGQTDAPAQTGQRALIDYRGPPVLSDGRSTVYPVYSFYDLFYSEQMVLGEETPPVDPGALRGKVVVVGITAAGLHDVFAVPFGSQGKMPGPQIHASVTDQVLAGRFIAPVGRPVRLLLLLAAALTTAALVVLLPMRASLPAAGVAAAALVWVAAAAFRAGTWYPVVVPFAGMAVAAFGGVAYQYFVEGREKRAVKRLFSRYLSRDVYEQLLANPALAELGGKRRDMTVLFSDIRGFTAMTEKGQAEDLVSQLNEYFSRMVEVVFAHRGTLDKFVGDMVMALFAAPLDDDRHADHAVQAAIAMVRELEQLNAKWAAEGRPTFGIGVGVNSGDMIAGNIGAEAVRSYTVIGDNVNLGSRLESLNKDYKTSIIVSAHTVERLRDAYDLAPLGEVVVKGKSRPVQIFEVRAGTSSQGAGTSADRRTAGETSSRG